MLYEASRSPSAIMLANYAPNKVLRSQSKALRCTRSELEVAKSRLTAAQSRRQVLEYEASIEESGDRFHRNC